MNNLSDLIFRSPSLNMHFSSEKMHEFIEHTNQLNDEKKQKLKEVLLQEKVNYPKLKTEKIKLQKEYLKTIAQVTTNYKFDIIHRAEDKSKKKDAVVLNELESDINEFL